MPTQPARAANGQFKRATSRTTRAKKVRDPALTPLTSTGMNDSSQSRFSAGRSRRAGEVAKVGLLTLALVCGTLGLAANAFWVAALIFMAVLWGLMIAGLQRSSARGPGPVAEAVSVAVDEARDIAGTLTRDAAKQPKK